MAGRIDGSVEQARPIELQNVRRRDGVAEQRCAGRVGESQQRHPVVRRLLNFDQITCAPFASKRVLRCSVRQGIADAEPPSDKEGFTRAKTEAAQSNRLPEWIVVTLEDVRE